MWTDVVPPRGRVVENSAHGGPFCQVRGMSRLEASAATPAARWHRPGAAPAEQASPADIPRLQFVSATERTEAIATLMRRRWVVAQVPDGLTVGTLGAAIDDSVEAALALRGAVPPGVDVDAEVEATLRDRVLRVRALDRPGLALSL